MQRQGIQTIFEEIETASSLRGVSKEGDESAEEKVEGEQVPSDVHKIKREGLPEEI